MFTVQNDTLHYQGKPAVFSASSITGDDALEAFIPYATAFLAYDPCWYVTGAFDDGEETTYPAYVPGTLTVAELHHARLNYREWVAKGGDADTTSLNGFDFDVIDLGSCYMLVANFDREVPSTDDEETVFLPFLGE